jgi:acyl-CoA ligase (AMP-forming) (exosortase A-associated)
LTELFHELVSAAAKRTPQGIALQDNGRRLDYAALETEVDQIAELYLALGLGRSDRVAVYLEKRLETVSALFGAARAGGVFVPLNPLLKAHQVAHILNDCNVHILVTSPERLELLRPVLAACPDLRAVVLIGMPGDPVPGIELVSWEERKPTTGQRPHRVIDTDMAAILYTSGSTGLPKGVVLSHRNLVAGAASVSRYLENTADDRILVVLPLSFDYGLSQLTTTFYVGATAVLMNYLLPMDVIRMLEREVITGLAAVPSLWMQLTPLKWPEAVGTRLRYITNSGGHMPGAVLSVLRSKLPETRIFLMYGLTEAFRSTYLPPEEVVRRPDSIGKAIPNAEVMVVREDGSLCEPGETGELVHRGIHVSMGYWNAPELTAKHFRPAPGQPAGLPLTEIAVWSGDSVRMDGEGYLYFVGRHDEMIKTSGYRVSPTEVEDEVYATGMVSEAAAIGVPHPVLGQAIVLVACMTDQHTSGEAALLEACRRELPLYMVPSKIIIRQASLPRNPNGKFDRRRLADEYGNLFETAQP